MEHMSLHNPTINTANFWKQEYLFLFFSLLFKHAMPVCETAFAFQCQS